MSLTQDSNLRESQNLEPIQAKPTCPLFQIKKWNYVAQWEWSVNSDMCAICRAVVMDGCSECQMDKKAHECEIVWGECNHSFHNCCMKQWILKSKRCPLCQKAWKTHKSLKIG